MHPCSVAVLGEALVDEFHDGAVAGGAPFNVARSVAALGAPVRFISRIGTADAAGELVLASAQRYGLNTDGLQRDPTHPTGRVTVQEADGQHHFHIHAPAAWDFIDATAAQAVLAEAPAPTTAPTTAQTAAQWLYFGSLAQRAATSRTTLRALAKGFRGQRLLDLNLRPGTDALLAAESLMLADWVKLNDDELAQLTDWFGLAGGGEPSSEATRVAELMARFALQQLVLTRGALGWRLYGPDGALQAEGAGVAQPLLQDTVGAGDAFTALLLAGLALARDLPATLSLANRYAAYICGVRGPLPHEPLALQPWRTALHALPRAA